MIKNCSNKESQQQEKVYILLNLIKENPDLKVIPMIDSDICCSDHNWYNGTWGDSEIDEAYYYNDRIYLKLHDRDELVEEYMQNICDAEITNDVTTDEETEYSYESLKERASQIVDNLNWEKIIVVYIKYLKQK
ncbi:MAG: hypothetical protein RR420_00880 [Anaerovoracaceae bacterium]